MYNTTIVEQRPGGSPQKRIAPLNLFEFEERETPALSRTFPDCRAKRREPRLPTPATRSSLTDAEASASRAGTVDGKADTPVKRPATTMERRRYQYPDGTKTRRLPPCPGTKLLARPSDFAANARQIMLNQTPQYEVRKIISKEKEQAAVQVGILTRQGRGWIINHRTREQALKAIAKLGPHACEHAGMVAQYTSSTEWMVRKAAAEALGAMGRPAAPQAHRVAALLGDRTPQCREAAVKALAAMGEKADSKFGHIVGRTIGNGFGSCDNSAAVRWAALTHLPVTGY